jgi:hypothetical protein
MTWWTPSPLRTTSFGQIGAHRVQGGGETRLVGAGDCRRRQQRHGVGRAGVAVDADAVEAAVDRRRQQAAQVVPRHLHVGQQIDQHGGHVGFDHARALGDAHDAAVAHHLSPDLRVKVGGHDALGGRKHRAGGQVARRRGDLLQHLLDRQAPADHPGGRRQHLLTPHAQGGAGGSAQPFGRCHAVGRPDVRDLVVHQDRPQGGLLQPAPAHQHGRANDGVAGEHRREVGGGALECDQRQDHAGRAGRFRRGEVEPAGGHPEPAGQDGLSLQPAAVLCPRGEVQIGAGHQL